VTEVRLIAGPPFRTIGAFDSEASDPLNGFRGTGARHQASPGPRLLLCFVGYEMLYVRLVEPTVPLKPSTTM
jgi:hypothetical protein